jgi:hypothetical protein
MPKIEAMAAVMGAPTIALATRCRYYRELHWPPRVATSAGARRQCCHCVMAACQNRYAVAAPVQDAAEI